MTTIPKPKHCGQNWLEMNPTDGGRICGQCNKVIIDFSKMSWAEIEQIQRQNNNAVCGMYNSQQLDKWGEEISTRKDKLLKVAIISGLTVSLSLPTYAQTTNPTKISIEGKITDVTTGEELPGVYVKLKHCKVETSTDAQGNFILIVFNKPTIHLPDTLEASFIGYKTTQIIITDIKEMSNINNQSKSEKSKHNIALVPSDNIINFYITKPTIWQRIKWKFKQWFGRKK